MNRTQSNYAKARVRLEKAESELRRAFNKWNKSREQVKRYEQRLDKEFVNRSTDIGGEADWRTFAEDK